VRTISEPSSPTRTPGNKKTQKYCFYGLKELYLAMIEDQKKVFDKPQNILFYKLLD
jgi:hypothetical protein